MHTIYEKILKRVKAPLRYLINQDRRITGIKKGNLLQVFWWEDYSNFGDDLNRVLALQFGFTPVRTSPENADVVMIGSVLDMVPDHYKGAILGSGFRSGGPKRNFKDAKIMAVRGHLTADRLSIPHGLRVLGDPGLLVSRFTKRKNPLYKVGLVPHLSDRTSSSFKRLSARFGDQCLTIDPRQSADKVISQIGQCSNILSSSLHGLITADALNIPSRWIHLSEKEIPAFKFHDYYSAFDESRTPIQISGNESLMALVGEVLSPPSRIEDVKFRLGECLDNYLSSIKAVKVLTDK